MSPKKRKREDTTVSLHPLTFREAVKELAESPPQKASRTKSAARPRSAKPKRR